MGREEINDMELENVVGGCFQFFRGGTRCKVQEGKYTCDADAQFQIINLINSHPEMTEIEIVDLAVSSGILKPL